MQMISATDVAIARALKAGKLVVTERTSRFGGTYFAIADSFGLIEVQNTRADLDARLEPIRRALA